VTVTVTDSSSPARFGTQNFAFNVRPEFTFTLPPAFPDGVVGRLYGNAPQAPQVGSTNVSGVVGNAPLTLCAAPLGTMGNPLITTKAGTTCLLSSTGTLTTPGTLTLTFSATDTPIIDNNSIPPVIVVPAGTVTGQVTLNVDAPFVLSNPVGGLGNGTEVSSFTATPTYTFTGGLPPAQTPAVTCAAGSGVPSGLNVGTGPNTCTLIGKPNVGTSVGSPHSVVLTVADAGNTATPPPAVPAPSPGTPLIINTALAFQAPALSVGKVGTMYSDFLDTGVTGNQPVTNCAVSGLPLGTGMSVPAAPAPTSSRCKLTGTPTAADLGMHPLTFTATDTLSSSTAANTATAMIVFTVNAGITVNPFPMAPAAVGQNYSITIGTMGGTLPVSACTVTANGSPLPGGTGFSIAPGKSSGAATMNDSCIFSGKPNAVDVAVNETITVSATDTATLGTPATTGSNMSTLTVNPALVANPFLLADGVKNRTFNETVTVTSANGIQPLTLCSVSGLPTGLTVPVAPMVSGANCTFTITGSPTAGSAPAVKVTVTDSTNANTTSTTTASTTTPLNVRPEFVVTAPSLPQGVLGRNYGVSPQTPPLATTTVSGAVGNSPLTMCSVSGQGGNSMASAISGTSCDLHSTAALITTAGSPYPIVFSATDSPITDPLNAAITVVPANTIMSSAAPLTVNVLLTLMNKLPNDPAGPMAPWTASAAQPYLNATPSLTVTTTGGLPPGQTTYVCTDTGATTFGSLGLTVAVVLGTQNCTLSGTPNATVVTNAPVAISVTDTGNSAVPALAPAVSTTSTLTINPQATITTTLTSPADDGVTNTDPSAPGPFPNFPSRPYSVTLAASNGTGALTFSSTGLNTLNCVGLTMNAAGMITGNPSVGVTQPATAVCSFTAKVTDSTATTTSTPLNITIQPPLEITPNFTPIPVAVNGRTYGMPAKMDLIFTATGGLAPQTIALGGVLPPTNIFCTPLGATLTCNSLLLGLFPLPVIGVTTTIMPTATDTANSTTAASAGGPTSETITVNPALGITVPRVINGLVGFTYPGITFTATGGTGVFPISPWTQGGAGACPPNAPPAGLTLGAMSGTLGMGGIPAGPAGSTTFQVCLLDAANSTTPAAASPGSQVGVTIFIVAPTAYAGDPGAHTIDVIDTTSHLSGAAIALAITATPSGIAVTPDGHFALTADSTNNTLIIVDTTTNAQITGSPFTIPAATNCATPTALAIAPLPTGAGANRAFIVCTSTAGSNVEEVLPVDISTITTPAFGTPLPTGGGSKPSGVAVRGDNARVYVTLNGSNQLAIINNPAGTPTLNGASPFTLDPTTTLPSGITVIPNAAKFYAYVAKDGTGNQGTAPKSQGVEVVDVTVIGATDTLADVLVNSSQTSLSIGTSNGDVSVSGTTVTVNLNATPSPALVAGNTVVISGVNNAGYNGTFVVTGIPSATQITYTDLAGGLGNSKNGTVVVPPVILFAPGAAPAPDVVAADPANANVFVTLLGTNQFTMLDNTATLPAQIATAPFNLPDPAGLAVGTPGGVTIPPVPSGTTLAYITVSNTNHAAVLNDTKPPTKAINPISLTGGAAPSRIASIPIPN
jgi:hypothetical protein